MNKKDIKDQLKGKIFPFQGISDKLIKNENQVKDMIIEEEKQLEQKFGKEKSFVRGDIKIHDYAYTQAQPNEKWIVVANWSFT